MGSRLGGLGAPKRRRAARSCDRGVLGKDTTLAMRPAGDQTREGCCSRANCWLITLCVFNWLATLAFLIFQDIISGAAFFLLAIAAVCALSGQCCGDKKDCCWRASLVVQGLGLALLVVAMILLSIWTHRVDKLPDPKCEYWAGTCSSTNEHTNGKKGSYGSYVTECKDPVPGYVVVLSVPGYVSEYTGYYSENGAEHFPAGDGNKGFTSSNGCGGFGNGKYDDDCIPIFTHSRVAGGSSHPLSECEEYWRNNQDDIREEWLKWLISMHVIQVVYLFANVAALRGYLARRPAAPAAEAELEFAHVALPANHGLKVAQGVILEGEVVA